MSRKKRPGMIAKKQSFWDLTGSVLYACMYLYCVCFLDHQRKKGTLNENKRKSNCKTKAPDVGFFMTLSFLFCSLQQCY